MCSHKDAYPGLGLPSKTSSSGRPYESPPCSGVEDDLNNADGTVSPPAKLVIPPSNTFTTDPYLASTAIADGVNVEFAASSSDGRAFAAIFPLAE